jgi:hypothetical protein
MAEAILNSPTGETYISQYAWQLGVAAGGCDDWLYTNATSGRYRTPLRHHRDDQKNPESLRLPMCLIVRIELLPRVGTCPHNTSVKMTVIMMP